MKERRECKDFIDIAAQAMKETPKAWLLNDGVTSQWVPKSLVKKYEDKDDLYRMPEWLANKRGFI